MLSTDDAVFNKLCSSWLSGSAEHPSLMEHMHGSSRKPYSDDAISQHISSELRLELITKLRWDTWRRLLVLRVLISRSMPRESIGGHNAWHR
jgi:hypothetical protein